MIAFNGEMKSRIDVRVDGRKRFQEVDGFGVNLNTKCWNGGKLVPALESLVDDLGATLFRLDAYGQSDWPDPTGAVGPRSLEQARLDRVYGGADFKSARDVGRWLNGRGIDPYVTISGRVPRWMCGPDGRTLRDFGAFGRMAGSYVEWARRKAAIRFTLFGPMNETDIGPPEGPRADPGAYARGCAALVAELDRRHLGDIRLVVAEQANYNLDYFKAMLRIPRVARRIGVFGVHTYGDGDMAGLVPFVRKSAARKARVWMTEFGDLEQTGEREWYVAWASFRRLLNLLSWNYEGAMFWDAFDNYHDHDEAWTVYGLLRTVQHGWFPKKRYHALKQVFRFVRPGMVRVGCSCPDPAVRVLAFADPRGRGLTVTGMNEGARGIVVNILAEGLDLPRGRTAVDIHFTSAELNCARVASVPASGRVWFYNGVVVDLPPGAIFTATTVR